MGSQGGLPAGTGRGFRAGTSGSGWSTGPGCTARRISASAECKHQTRGPSRSPGRAPGTEELVTRWPMGCGQAVVPPPGQQSGEEACQHRVPAGAEVCQSLSKQASPWQQSHPTHPGRSGTQLAQPVGASAEAGQCSPPSWDPPKSIGCSGQRVGGLTVRCQEQWVLGE